MKFYNRQTICRLTQPRTSHGFFGVWNQRIGIDKDIYNYVDGELETVRDMLVDCHLLDFQQQEPGRVSQEMDLLILLNSVVWFAIDCEFYRYQKGLRNKLKQKKTKG